MTNLFFVFYDSVEFLQDLQQFIGILCIECRDTQLSPALAPFPRHRLLTPVIDIFRIPPRYMHYKFLDDRVSDAGAAGEDEGREHSPGCPRAVKNEIRCRRMVGQCASSYPC
jgi:hypothetical protein